MNRPLATLFAGACLAAASMACKAQKLDEFAYALPIEGTGGDAFYRVVIPQPVYESAAFADLRDLRVFNGQAETVPHAFRSAQPVSLKSEAVPLPFFPLRGPRNVRAEDLDLSVGRAGGKVSVRLLSRDGEAGRPVLLGYLIDASALKVPLAGISVAWGKAGAGRLTSVRLEAGDDLKHWNTLAADAPLGAVAHAGQRLERDAIEFRSVQSRYLRLSWADPDQAIELDAVRGLPPEQAGQPERLWKEVTAVPDPGEPGAYGVDLNGRFPLDRLELRLPQENTVVPVQVLSRNDPDDPWMPVSATVAYRLRQEGREFTSPAVALHGSGQRYWRLRTDMKGGGIGAGTLIVRAGWIPREIVFTARGNAPFRLAYGNARAEPSALAAHTLVPDLDSAGKAPIAVVATGAPQRLAGDAATVARIDARKWGLWAALCAGVAVLGWMAWRLSAQMKRNAGD